MRYIERAKSVAYEYKSNCTELMCIRNDDKPVVPSVSIHTKGRISNPIEAEVIAKEMRPLVDQRFKYLLQATQAVEFALAMVQRKRHGDITVKLFEMVYRDATHRLYGAAIALNISERTAQSYNAYLIKMIALRMGYIPIVN
ncbi:MAG: hypothetical protein ACYCWE_09690 [Eubacteriales bacterium]